MLVVLSRLSEYAALKIPHCQKEVEINQSICEIQQDNVSEMDFLGGLFVCFVFAVVCLFGVVRRVAHLAANILPPTRHQYS